MTKNILCNMYCATTHKHVGQLEISVDKLSCHTFQVSDKHFLGKQTSTNIQSKHKKMQ